MLWKIYKYHSFFFNQKHVEFVPKPNQNVTASQLE